jgi:hypothetical protein
VLSGQAAAVAHRGRDHRLVDSLPVDLRAQEGARREDLRRIAHGIMKFVVNNPKPFIVPLTHHQPARRGASVDEPMATVTGANRGEHAIVVPHVTKFRERGDRPRRRRAAAPSPRTASSSGPAARRRSAVEAIMAASSNIPRRPGRVSRGAYSRALHQLRAAGRPQSLGRGSAAHRHRVRRRS